MNREKQNKMKPAYIEQMLMWMVIFIAFVWMFFFVLNYATAIRLKDSMDDMSKFAARFISNLTSTDQANVSTNQTLLDSLNNISIGMIDDVDSTDLVCAIATTSPENSNAQSIFIVQGTYTKSFLSGQGENNVQSKTVVYNNGSAAQISCTLSVTIN